MSQIGGKMFFDSEQEGGAPYETHVHLLKDWCSEQISDPLLLAS